MRLVHIPARLWHKHGALKHDRHRPPPRPLDRQSLERLAVRYVERYATTRARLTDYLRRKLRERGWEDPEPPAPEALAERMHGLGYVDDAGFALSRASSLQRRGYGERRVRLALSAAGIAEEDGAPALAEAESGAWAAALRFAERKRIGPFAGSPPDRPLRERQLAMMMRAGHRLDHARRVLACRPGEVPDLNEL